MAEYSLNFKLVYKQSLLYVNLIITSILLIKLPVKPLVFLLD